MEYEGKPFSDVLREIEGGRFVDDLTRDLRKVVNAVLETRKAGMLAITIKVVPTGRGSIEGGAEKMPRNSLPPKKNDSSVTSRMPASNTHCTQLDAKLTTGTRAERICSQA